MHDCNVRTAPTAHETRMAGIREPIGADDARNGDAHRLLGNKKPDAIRAAAARPPRKQIEWEACALEKRNIRMQT